MHDRFPETDRVRLDRSASQPAASDVVFRGTFYLMRIILLLPSDFTRSLVNAFIILSSPSILLCYFYAAFVSCDVPGLLHCYAFPAIPKSLHLLIVMGLEVYITFGPISYYYFASVITLLVVLTSAGSAFVTFPKSSVFVRIIMVVV